MAKVESGLAKGSPIKVDGIVMLNSDFIIGHDTNKACFCADGLIHEKGC